ncbi:MAG: hypothetical protein FJ098_09285, partial [Deltaproteobacteria bacterium]|nr:hypothetical protein [Deltaproteobacteria bacterium]
ERVIGGLGRVAALAGRGFTLEDFLRTEQFGPVDRDLDYGRSTHVLEAANYIRERHKGVKVRFDRHIREIALEMTRRLI